MADERQSDLVRLAPLWKRKSKAGNKYLGGQLGDAPAVVLPNTYKEDGSNQPDYYLYVSPRRRKDDASDTPQDTPQVSAPVAEDDLPF